MRIAGPTSASDVAAAPGPPDPAAMIRRINAARHPVRHADAGVVHAGVVHAGVVHAGGAPVAAKPAQPAAPSDAPIQPFLDKTV